MGDAPGVELHEALEALAKDVANCAVAGLLPQLKPSSRGLHSDELSATIALTTGPITAAASSAAAAAAAPAAASRFTRGGGRVEKIVKRHALVTEDQPGTRRERERRGEGRGGKRRRHA